MGFYLLLQEIIFFSSSRTTILILLTIEYVGYPLNNFNRGFVCVGFLTISFIVHTKKIMDNYVCECMGGSL